MIDSYYVVATVPAGRQRYLEILLPYLLAKRGLIDHCDLWCNTTDRDDIAYIRQIAATDSFFQVIEPRLPVEGIRSVHQFFRNCVDPRVVYLRFDDDICWIAPDAVEKLLRFRLDNPNHPLVFANTVNNGVCSHIHQRIGCIPMDLGFCHYDATGELGCGSGDFARLAHEAFLKAHDDGSTGNYLFPKWLALEYERISINCICWFGREFRKFDGEVDVDDEPWLTMSYPAQLGRPNAICGAALVSHFAYGTQRPWLEAHTSLLERYRALAEDVSRCSAAGAWYVVIDSRGKTELKDVL